MADGFYVKTALTGAWKTITNFYVKTGLAGWSQVTDAWIKTGVSTWSKFWSALMSPSQVVEIIESYGGFNSQLLRLQGKNYVWSPTPQSLKYYFRQTNEDGTTYVGPGGSSGSTASNTVSTYPSSTTYELINNEDFEYKIGGLNKYFFEVRATGASGTIYSSISQDTVDVPAPAIYSPLAPTLTEVSKTSTTVTIKITAAADTTGPWGFSSWAATYRYIVYTYDSVNGIVYSGGGRGGIEAISAEQNVTLTGLTAGRQYDIYVMPTTGNSGSRPVPYNASTQTNGYSGYEGLEAYITVTPGVDYSFSFGNSLYIGTNGYIGLDTAGSSDALPTTGKFLSIFPADLQQDTTTSIWYWSDYDQYVIRWEGYTYGSPTATKVYQATFYAGQGYADVKAISMSGSAAGTTAYYKNGVVQSSYPSALSTGASYRVYFDTTAPTSVSVTEKSKSVMKQVTGLTSGSLDQGYTTLVTATNQTNFIPGTIKITGGSTETASGKVTTGATLTAVTNNDWPSGTTFTYQWYRTRDIEGIAPTQFGTASTVSSTSVGESLYCIVSYSNSGTTGSVYSYNYQIVPSAPSYTLTGGSGGSFTISSVSVTGGSYYFGTYTKDGGSATSISRSLTSSNTTINSGNGSIATRLYGSANISYSGSGTVAVDSWEYTDKTTTVTALSSPTISSVSYNNSTSTWTVNYSGGSGPYYQIWYQGTTSTTTVPTLVGSKTSNPDASSSSASSTDKLLSASAGTAYYWWVRSATTLNGTGDGNVSDWNGPVTMSPMNTATPTLTGTAKVGQTLTFGTGTWVNATYYDLELYRGTQFVATSETQAKDAGNTTSSTYTIPSSDFTDPNNRKYYRSFAKGLNPSYTSTSFVGGAEIGPLVNVTLYTITFDSKGGTAVSSLTQSTEGGSISQPTNPTKTDNTFGGWSTTDGGTTAVSWPRTPSSNETLYAIWTAVATGPGNPSGGSISTPSLTRTMSTSLTRINNTTKDQYWSAEVKSDFTVSWTAGSGATSHEVYYSSSSTAPTASTSASYSNLTTSKADYWYYGSSSITYYYWVRARNSNGTSSWVSCGSVTIPALSVTSFTIRIYAGDGSTFSSPTTAPAYSTGYYGWTGLTSRGNPNANPPTGIGHYAWARGTINGTVTTGTSSAV